MIIRSSNRILYDVIATLLHREWRQRTVRGRWLTAWTAIEPLLQIVAIASLYKAYGHTTVAGQEAYIFVGIAIFSFVAFRNLATKPSDAIIVSSGLLTYRQVHVLDLILSKWLAELIGYILLTTTALLWLVIVEESIEIHAADFMFGIFVLLCISLGITCTLANIRRDHPWITTYFRPIFFALYISSGALHPVWALPEEVERILTFNPIVQTLELLRQSILFHYNSSLQISKPYLLIWAFCTLTFGITQIIRNSDKLRAR